MSFVKVQKVLQSVLANDVAVEHKERVPVVQQLSCESQWPRRTQWLGLMGTRDLDMVLSTIKNKSIIDNTIQNKRRASVKNKRNARYVLPDVSLHLLFHRL